ncbi:MAG: AMP-binding protein, partial [Polyangiales bacterium]
MRELSVLQAAREVPDRDFLITPQETFCYADVAERTRHAMAGLTRSGVALGARVAISPDANIDSIVWLLALFELGCPAVLLHPRLSVRERETIVDKVDPERVLDGPPPTGGSPDRVSANAVPEEQILAVVFSSGSGERARGISLSRRAFIASSEAHARNLGWLPSDRWLLAMPPAHVGGFSILTRCLIARAAIVLANGSFDPGRTIRALESQRVSLLSVVPTMLHRLLESTTPRWEPSPSLRAVLVGGAQFPDSLRRRAAARGVPAVGTYGLTEACSQVATQRLTEVGKAGSGAPLFGIKVRIRGGEIQVAGPTMMNGYLDAEDDAAGWTEDG